MSRINKEINSNFTANTHSFAYEVVMRKDLFIVYYCVLYSYADLQCRRLSKSLTESCYNIVIADDFTGWAPLLKEENATNIGSTLLSIDTFIRISKFEEVFILIDERFCVNFIVFVSDVRSIESIVTTITNNKLTKLTKAIIICHSNVAISLNDDLLQRIYYGNLYDFNPFNNSLQR